MAHELIQTKNGIPVLDPHRQPKKVKEKRDLKHIQKVAKHAIKFNHSTFIDKKIAIYWDIENISKKCVLKSKNEILKKGDKKFLSYATETINFELLDDWTKHKVNTGDDAADHDLIEEIVNDIDFYDLFIIISNDNIFLEVIDELLEKNKYVLHVKTHVNPSYFLQNKEFVENEKFFLYSIEKEIESLFESKKSVFIGNSFVGDKIESVSIFIKIKRYIFKFLNIL